MVNYKLNIPAYLVTIVIFSMIMAFYILAKYANRKVFRIHIYITVFCQYFCTFCIILLIPADLTMTFLGRHSTGAQEYYHKNKKKVMYTYASLYWTITILSNFILIVQEQYNSNGFFTVFTRLKNSLWQLSLQLLAGITCFIILFGILVGSQTVGANFYAVFLTSISITNTIWITFLMLVLGYGLIMYPYDFWTRGNHELRLTKIQKEIAKEFENVTIAYSEIYKCVANIKQTEREILFLSDDVKKNLDIPMKILKQDIPIDITTSPFIGKIIVNKKNNLITIGSLAHFREKIYWNNCIFTSSQGRLNSLQTKAYFLEDLIGSNDDISNIDAVLEGHRYINWTFGEKSTWREYMWYITIKPYLYKFASVVFGILSTCTYLGIVSNITPIPYNVSPYYVIINNIDIDTDPYLVTFFTFVTLGYLFFVIKWSLFEMKFFKSLRLIGSRGTWPVPMSFNSRIFGSLACPFIFVYLSLIHENGILTNQNKITTIFSNFYEMSAIPILGNPFNAFFPILLLVVSLLTSVNMLNRFLVSIRCSAFQFGDLEISNDLFEEGKLKLSKRKKLIKRAYKLSMHGSDKKIKKTGLSNFLSGFSQQSKFHSDGFVINDDIDIESQNNALEYSSLSITQDVQPQYTFKNLGKRLECISEAFSNYDTRSPEHKNICLKEFDNYEEDISNDEKN